MQSDSTKKELIDNHWLIFERNWENVTDILRHGEEQLLDVNAVDVAIGFQRRNAVQPDEALANMSLWEAQHFGHFHVER